MKDFKLVSDYSPTGDQPEAICKLVEGLKLGYKAQTLLGVTGSGKTYTIANLIKEVQRPALVIAHNKTLAAQLYSEFKEFFPENCVEYFVSYYDYYQPEAYVVKSDTFIEKDADINFEIDKLRHSATAALFERRDVIIVASVSCIYGLGDPEVYRDLMLSLRPGMSRDRDEIMEKLVDIQFLRNDINFVRGTFRVRGDVLEIFPSYSDTIALRIEFFGDEIERICEIEAITGKVLGERSHIFISPASHHATTKDHIDKAIKGIKDEMLFRVKEFEDNNKLLEAQRIKQRTLYDIEMLKELGSCAGIENYSRHLSAREAGSRPYTLIDYFPEDFVTIIDESHVTIPQIRGMYNGDKARKDTLVDHGFRLPSALDNRPLRFEEFDELVGQRIFVSATPSNYERENSSAIVEQIIRPTGLIDPPIFVRPVEGQIDDLYDEIKSTTIKGYRTLVTTLTKKMAEDLTKYLDEVGLKVKYLHSDIDTLERIEIIRDLRLGVFDVLVGINLLREGLDIPEVALVAILDADKEGFLRSETSLIQTIGRAARNTEGKVIMYADRETDSMKKAIYETDRRRMRQEEYNNATGITPTSIKKGVRGIIEATKVATDSEEYRSGRERIDDLGVDEINRKIISLEIEMRKAAHNLRFEEAAEMRDQIEVLRQKLKDFNFN